MRKLLSIILLLSSLTLHSQNFDFKVKPVTTPITDLSVLTATTVYWMYNEKPQPDKIIHFLFGYFATNAMYQIMEYTEFPRGLKIGVPIVVWGSLSLFKEVMLDGSPDWNDFKAGMLGCGISVISFQLTYTIQYKSRSASALIINN